MILACSRGHIYDTNDLLIRMNHGDLDPGQRCPMVMSYDRMSGSTYCRRILREKVQISSHPVVKIGTQPAIVTFDKRQKLYPGNIVKFRVNCDGAKWETGKIDDIASDIIFISRL